MFKGPRLSEFWWWFLTYTVVTFVLRLVFRTLRNLTDSGVIATVGDSFSSIWGLIVLVPTIALGVRRLHDINMRGTVLAIIYAVQAAAGIFFAIGLILIIGSSLSFQVVGGRQQRRHRRRCPADPRRAGLHCQRCVHFCADGPRFPNPEGTRFRRSYGFQRMGSRHGRGSADRMRLEATSYGNVPLPTNPAAAAPAAPYTVPTTPADSYTAPAPQYDAAQQHAAPQYAAPQQNPLAEASVPSMPPMPAVPTMPPTPSIPPMPEVPAQFQHPHEQPNTDAPADSDLRQYRMIRRTAPISSSDFALIPALSPQNVAHHNE